jgi:hypothetical protein
MNTQLTVDLSLVPNTLDLYHVILLGAVLTLALILIILLLITVLNLFMKKPATAKAEIQVIPEPLPEPTPAAEPEIKIVEKIVEVEVEKIVEVQVPAPASEPIILREATPDAALQLLGLLQKEARFIDFMKEDVSSYSDDQVGAAARVVHAGCNKALNEHFSIDQIRTEQENMQITLLAGFDASTVRLTGNIIGEAPYTGTLIHKGWIATNIRLPKLTEHHNANVLAPAEVEL